MDMTELIDDVQAEHDDLASLLATEREERWARPTPSPGWTVRDQITHLAFFDDITRLAIAEPRRFEEFRDGIPDLQAYVDRVSTERNDLTGQQLLEWWAHERRSLISFARQADPATRIPWFGPTMSLASKLTARLMETWAHGQDVVDALGLRREGTIRLKHVARIGVLALPNSFRINGLDVPSEQVRVSLESPDGLDLWEWGDENAENYVEGRAEDFCLVVTQRRHPADTALRINGSVAASWMAVAQAFAGQPGQGRSAGQFPGQSTPRQLQ